MAPRLRGAAACGPTPHLIRRFAHAASIWRIDFHGGPRASLLTWLSGATRRVGYEVVGRGVDVHATREPSARAAARHSVVQPVGSAGAARHRRRPIPGRFQSRWLPSRDAAAAVLERLAAAGVAPAARLIVIHVSANPVSAMAARLVRRGNRDDRPGGRGPQDRGHVRTIGSRCRRSHHRGRARPAAGRGRGARAPLRRVFAGRASSAGRCRGALHRRRQRAAAHRGRIEGADRGAVRSDAAGPVAPWRSGDLRSEAVDAGELPCRPCDQRVCEPGDFRCLTRIPPDAVVNAAERLLAVRS